MKMNNVRGDLTDISVKKDAQLETDRTTNFVPDGNSVVTWR